VNVQRATPLVLVVWVLAGLFAQTSSAQARKWTNGIVCIRAIRAAGAEPYVKNISSFTDWLENFPSSFYIAGISIAPQKTGARDFNYRLRVSNAEHQAGILHLARQYDRSLLVSAVASRGPLHLDGVQTRWASWFPSRASLGYARPDSLADFARVLLSDIDGIFYVETQNHFKLQVFTSAQQAEGPAFQSLVRERLKGLPGTLTIRSDVFNSRIHQALLERTTPAVLEAIRTRPEATIDIALESYPNEERTLVASLAEIMKIEGALIFHPESQQYDLLQLKCGRRIFASVPAGSIPSFIEYFSIKKVLLVPEDCEDQP
jgi:hypothetical protein